MQPLLNISAAERETGLSKDLLRVWERRYGFPSPARDANGDRSYAQDEIDKLRAIRRLMDQGMRPGRLIDKTLQQLNDLASRLEPAMPEAADSPATQVLTDLLGLLEQNRRDDFRRGLAASVDQFGLYRFVAELCPALCRRVGEKWLGGSIAIHQEHDFTQMLQVVLHAAIAEVKVVRTSPRVVLATLTGEAHGLGLLMVEALLTLESATCVSLGCQLPAVEIAESARGHAADIVAISFSSAYPPNALRRAIGELRALLPATQSLWIGGAGSSRIRAAPSGVVVIEALGDVARGLADWHSARRGNGTNATC